MDRLAKTGDVTMMDAPKFGKNFCRILTYPSSIKMLHPDDSLSEPKFRTMLQSHSQAI
jgi:hypothetical protein